MRYPNRVPEGLLPTGWPPCGPTAPSWSSSGRGEVASRLADRYTGEKLDVLAVQGLPHWPMRTPADYLRWCEGVSCPGAVSTHLAGGEPQAVPLGHVHNLQRPASVPPAPSLQSSAPTTSPSPTPTRIFVNAYDDIRAGERSPDRSCHGSAEGIPRQGDSREAPSGCPGVSSSWI